MSCTEPWFSPSEPLLVLRGGEEEGLAFLFRLCDCVAVNFLFSLA
jgi:hypothetical protein